MSTKCAVRKPYSSRGDGNQIILYLKTVLGALENPIPREGTETIVIKKY